MPGFRRWGKSKFQKNPESSFKLLAAVLVITLYLIIKEFSHPTVRVDRRAPSVGASIQCTDWKVGVDMAESDRADRIRNAMKFTFWKYREHAWGFDDIKPVTGGHGTSRNGWGAFIVDSSTTLALMELWDELALCVNHILSIDFTTAVNVVDPFETTIRYLGGLVSLIDLSDAGLIPKNIIDQDARDLILEQAITLANKLGPAYDTPTGMPWPRVNFTSDEGEPDPPSVYLEHPDRPKYEHQTIGPARTGSSILENRVLTRLTGDNIYAQNSTKAWAPLVWSQWETPWKGFVDSPIDIITGAPAGRSRHWDGGSDSYYEYLLKITLLAPPNDPHIDVYKQRFLDSAFSLRKHLGSRSSPAPAHVKQHQFIGRQQGEWYDNRMTHLACFAPGTLLLGAKAYNEQSLRTFALALLEGCRHTYSSTPSKVGPEEWAWIPKFGYDDPVFKPITERRKKEWNDNGFFAIRTDFKGRPEYVESLFYAWRITGDVRYRTWAWEAFQAMEKWTKTRYGYAQLVDVWRVLPEEWPGDGNDRFVDMQESFWAAETLKYLWLTFSSTEKANLNNWVFSTEGHVFRMSR